MLHLIVALTMALSAGGSFPGELQSTKEPVYVAHSGDDPVGIEVAYHLREAINRSSLYRLSSTAKEANYGLSIVSISMDGDAKNVSSALAVAYLSLETTGPRYMTLTVHTVGRNRTDSVAKGILSQLDKEIRDSK